MKKPLLIIGSVLFITILGWVFYDTNFQKLTLPHPNPELKTPATQKDSTVTITDNTSLFALEAYDKPVYIAEKKHIAAVEEFIQSAPRYEATEFIPDNFLRNSTLERSVHDKDDPSLQNNGTALSNEHYFFNQTINDIPVFSAQLVVHLRNDNEIYSVQGNLLKNTSVDKAKIPEEQAREIALQKARSDSLIPQENQWDPDAPATAPKERPLSIDTAKKYILNKKILGESDDEKNYLTLAVLVRNTDPNSEEFAKEYFVDLTTGTIVYQQDYVHEALSRQVSCASGACTVGRNEGQPPSSTAGVNMVYDLLGTYYNFMQQNFQRDSLDGNGGNILAVLKPPCKNASWNGTNISICSDMINPDVVFHELTHGVTTFSVRLARTIPSGTINEGNADIFAVGMQGDYVMTGADGAVIRDLGNPASKNQPDTMFSPNFRCPGEVHHESTVMGHAFYLMAEGGTKNNCSISPIGKANALKIQYLALTRYYTANTNYRIHYTALMNACNDLFQQGSSTCRQVQAALAATQIDQQPATTQNAAKCSGIAAKPVVCPAPVNATQPTAVPTKAPTIPQATTAPTVKPTGAIQPTAAPSMDVALPTFTSIGDCTTNHNCPPTDVPHIEPTEILQIPTAPAVPVAEAPKPTTGSSDGILNLFLQFIILIISALFGR